MNLNKIVSTAAVLACLAAVPALAPAQVSIQIGPEPVCPYGYYDYAPYACAPYGYYGPTWFHAGVFVGAGPWFHGPEGFHGYVDNHYDPHHGYHGPYPQHGYVPHGHPMAPQGFHGNEMRGGYHGGGGPHGR